MAEDKKHPARFIVEFEGGPLSDDEVRLILNDIVKSSIARARDIKSLGAFDQWGSFDQWQSFGQHT